MAEQNLIMGEIKAHIDWLRRHIEDESFASIEHHICDIDKEVIDFCNSVNIDKNNDPFAWFSYEKPYVEMLISGLTVYPVM